MILVIYTLLHTLISLVGIVSGFVVVVELVMPKVVEFWTKLFLWSTLATSVTGFFFPFHGFKPSYVLGALSILVLIIALKAFYKHRLAGGWRTTYIITAFLALYFNFFVLIVQSFEKIPFLRAVAPTQTEAPFKDAQTVAFLVFFITCLLAIRNTRVSIGKD